MEVENNMNFWITLMTTAPQIVGAFLTPEKIKALIKAWTETMEYVDALNSPDPSDDYQAALEFAIAQYGLLDAVCGFEHEVDKFFIETVIPYGLNFFYPKMTRAQV
jgi:hypothetical protein